MADVNPPLAPPVYGPPPAPSPIDPVAPLVDSRTRYSEADEDTDMLLVSSDDVDFYVSSVVLKLASSVFRDMFSMPQPRDAAGDEVKPNGISRKDAISLSEPADVLCLLLDIIYPGRGLSEDLEIFVDRTVLPLLKLAGLAALKYAMSSALKAIRAFILSPKTGTKYNAVELYGVASDLGLVDEAKRLSAKTLKCNLNTLETRKYFENMGLDAVLKLQHLHRQRKIILINALFEMTGDGSFYPDASQNYGVVAYPVTAFAARMPLQLKLSRRGDFNAEATFLEWTKLRTEVSQMMEQSVDGTRFFRDEQDFFYGNKFPKLREIMDFRMLAREFRRIFESMPKEVDV